jgi:hypothetical protein
MSSRWGGKPQGQGPLNPTSIENLFDPTNFTAPGTFYYDRVCATFLSFGQMHRVYDDLKKVLRLVFWCLGAACVVKIGVLVP